MRVCKIWSDVWMLLIVSHIAQPTSQLPYLLSMETSFSLNIIRWAQSMKTTETRITRLLPKITNFTKKKKKGDDEFL